MQLFWHGYSSIRIEAKNGDQSCTIITDPFENESAIRFPRTVESDAVLLSKEDRYLFNLEGVNGSPFIISRPGEYEVKGVFVNGIKDPKIAEDNIIYRIFAEGISVAFFGQLKRRPTNDELERLERVDVLMLPVGGGDVMDSSLAAEVISDIEPRIVVPLYYDLPGLKKSLGNVETFCKHIGSCQRENMNRLKIQQKDLPADTMLVAVLERA
ncbi:MAG: MBL fold metallo-hydrolase [Candidatus Uhrbacteria bacterium]|nr:MBL fold metallo-hydrolase [Candidatus Uhrbacteria bacterium]